MESKADALKKLARWCAERERAPAELRAKFREYDLDDQEREDIEQQLRQDGFINEERFALAYAGGKFRINKWGRLMIRQGLISKGIKGEVLEDALQSLDPDDYNRTLDSLISSKARSLKGYKEAERNSRLIRFAYSKGFEQEAAWESIRRLDL